VNALATVHPVALDDALARRLRRASELLDRHRQGRDQLIREAHEAGASYREIAAAVGLSHVGVMKIVGKEDPNARLNAIKRERERLSREAREHGWNGLKKPEAE
jgi:uncharacterized coiled-coil DUF342 family protein